MTHRHTYAQRMLRHRRPGLLFVAAAVAVTPLLAAAAEPSPCSALLTGLAGAAAWNGYDVMDADDEVVGVDIDQHELRARCNDDHAVVEFAAADGSRVGQGIKCFAAFKCWKNDCSGDGKA